MSQMPATQDFELPQQLVDMQDAKTVGDLLEIAFPVAVGRFDPARLARYVDDADMRLYDPFDEEGPEPLKVADVRMTRQGHLRRCPTAGGIHPAFQECAAITRATEAKLLDRTGGLDKPGDYRLLMEGRANSIPHDGAGGFIVPSIHGDVSDNPPNGRRYLASSEQPTFFVPHDDTARILKDLGYEKILNYKLDPDGPDLGGILPFFSNVMSHVYLMMPDAHDNHPQSILNQAFREALQPAELGTVTAFSPLTFHTNPGRPKFGRVLFEADAHTVPGFKADHGQMLSYAFFNMARGAGVSKRDTLLMLMDLNF